MKVSVEIRHADVLQALTRMSSNFADAALSDPPYGLNFLGLDWDKVLPPQAVWVELLRVLRPGAHALVFGGTRTFHRLGVSVEDAGFDVLDTLAWVYGQGMPKSRSSLKPAWEPVLLLRKPGKQLPLNINGCRLEQSRWPANLALDAEAAAQLDVQAGVRVSGTMGAGKQRARKDSYSGSWGGAATKKDIVGNSGGASRFFYCTKVRGPDREHPTQKPVELTSWLATLLHGEGLQRIVVPYAGYGSEVLGAVAAGWSNVVGIENDAKWVKLSRKRIAEAMS